MCSYSWEALNLHATDLGSNPDVPYYLIEIISPTIYPSSKMMKRENKKIQNLFSASFSLGVYFLYYLCLLSLAMTDLTKNLKCSFNS